MIDQTLPGWASVFPLSQHSELNAHRIRADDCSTSGNMRGIDDVLRTLPGEILEEIRKNVTLEKFWDV